MADLPTFLPQLTATEFARRLCDIFPPGWASETAKSPGGVFYAMMATLAGSVGFELAIPATQELTLAGALASGDLISLTFTNPNLDGAHTLRYTVLITDTLATAASALAGLISADPVLSPIGFRAVAIGARIQVKYPTRPPSAEWTTASPPTNATVIFGTTTGAETVTVVTDVYIGPGAAQYAADATRIQTAQGQALDLAGLDYFGTADFTLPRLSGEPDAAYRQRILAALLPSGATRAAVAAALTRVTGVPPRIVEPWNPGDTGVIDGVETAPGIFAGAMYLDVDTAATPNRITDPGLAYQGFIETVLPTEALLGGNPVPCLDDGMYCDAPGSSIFDLGSVANGLTAVYNAVNAAKTYGTVCWVRFAAYQRPVDPPGRLAFDAPSQSAQWMWLFGLPQN